MLRSALIPESEALFEKRRRGLDISSPADPHDFPARRHRIFDVFQDMLPLRWAQALRVAVVAVLADALLAMLWLGGQYVHFAWGQETPVLNWNFGAIYLAIPSGALLMLVYLGFVAVPYVKQRAFRKDAALSPEEATL